MSNEQSIRDELIELRLASYSKIMSDGYPSGIIRSNEEAADVLLASPVIRRIQAEAFEAAWRASGDGYNGEWPDEGVPWADSAGREAFERWIEKGQTND